MIKVKNLSYKYDLEKSKALENINFSLNSGEILAVIGKTGCGKSTLASLLGGIFKPLEGKILFNGEDIHEKFKSEIFSKIGVVFQFPENQLFEKTVFEDIAFGPKSKGFSEEKIKEMVYKTAKILDIKKEILNFSPFSISGGEKRKCAIAGIMVLEPKVLVLDEPTAGLDYDSKKNLLKYIKNYSKVEDKSIVFISHNMEEVAEISDKVLILSEGKQIAYGKTEEIFQDIKKIKSVGLDVPQISKIMNLVFKKIDFKSNSNIIKVSEAENQILNILGLAVHKND